MTRSPFAGKEPKLTDLIDLPQLVSAFYTKKPDPSSKTEQVAFGTSGHRGCSLNSSFNEDHILAITQGICDFRKQKGIEGPLFLGIDTHALSYPAMVAAIEVLVANEVKVKIAKEGEFTPTPVISHAILVYNRANCSLLSDGIVITPSHNPPKEGGFKYNGVDGGPASEEVTNAIQKAANDYLKNALQGIKRLSFEKALDSPFLERHDFMDSYIADLENVVDMKAIKDSDIRLGVDPLGGAGVHYWKKIKEKYDLNLVVVREIVDPTFRFMTLDWDGQIRMDPSSADAMRSLIGLKDQFDVAFACDTDHDRHGIVTKSFGLLPANHYLSAAVYYLLTNRPLWKKEIGIAKTVVTTEMIDKIAHSFGRKVKEFPVGFKWFVEDLLKGDVGFAGEESAGASFLRMDGSVWTTDKDGIIAALLAAEMTAKLKKDPGEIYLELSKKFGAPKTARIEIPVNLEEKAKLKKITPAAIEMALPKGIKMTCAQTEAEGKPIGGIKVIFENGWFAARPSGTEDFCKVYAEVFGTDEELQNLLKSAEKMVKEYLKQS